MESAIDYRIISADDHIDLQWLPKDLWQKRVPLPLQERAPRVVDTPDGPYWVCGEDRWDPWAYNDWLAEFYATAPERGQSRRGPSTATSGLWLPGRVAGSSVTTPGSYTGCDQECRYARRTRFHE